MFPISVNPIDKAVKFGVDRQRHLEKSNIDSMNNFGKSVGDATIITRLMDEENEEIELLKMQDALEQAYLNGNLEEMTRLEGLIDKFHANNNPYRTKPQNDNDAETLEDL